MRARLRKRAGGAGAASASSARAVTRARPCAPAARSWAAPSAAISVVGAGIRAPRRLQLGDGGEGIARALTNTAGGVAQRGNAPCAARARSLGRVQWVESERQRVGEPGRLRGEYGSLAAAVGVTPNTRRPGASARSAATGSSAGPRGRSRRASGDGRPGGPLPAKRQIAAQHRPGRRRRRRWPSRRAPARRHCRRRWRVTRPPPWASAGRVRQPRTGGPGGPESSKRVTEGMGPDLAPARRVRQDGPVNNR